MRNLKALSFGAAALLALSPALCSAADPLTEQKQAADVVSGALDGLQSPDFHMRAKAAQIILSLGQVAASPLAKVVKEGDAKRAEWAEDMLALVRAGDKKDSPQELLDLRNRYLTAAAADRQEAVKDFPWWEKKALPVLLSLLEHEANPELRQALFERIFPIAGDPVKIALYRIEATTDTRQWIADHLSPVTAVCASRLVALCAEEPEKAIRRALMYNAANFKRTRSVQMRAAAARLVWPFGPCAIAPLTQLAKNRNAKLAEWAGDMLVLLRAADMNGMPREMLALEKSYLQCATPKERSGALADLPFEDRKTLPILLDLLMRETDPDLRQMLTEHVKRLASVAIKLALFRVEPLDYSRGNVVAYLDGHDTVTGQRLVAFCADEPERQLRLNFLYEAFNLYRTRGVVTTALDLYLNENDESIRRDIAGHMTPVLPDAVAPLIVQGHFEKAEKLLEDAAIGNVYEYENPASHYAAFLLMRGNLDARLEELSEAEDEPENHENRALLIRRLRQVKANVAAVRAADPSNAQHPTSENTALWKKRLAALRDSLPPAEGVAVPYRRGDIDLCTRGELAFCLGMIGDAAGRMDEITTIRAGAVKKGSLFHDNFAVEVLLLNGEFDAAFSAEAESGEARDLCEHLTICGRYREADEAMRKLADQREDIECSRLIFLAGKMLDLGDRERAEKIGHRVAEIPLEESAWDHNFSTVFFLFKRLGWDDKAAEYARRVDDFLSSYNHNLQDKWGFEKRSINESWERAKAAFQFYQGGLKEFALPILDEVFEPIKDVPDELLDYAADEFKCGLTDRAYAHLDLYAAHVPDEGTLSQDWVVEHFFPYGSSWSRELKEEVWRQVRRVHAGEAASVRLKVCRDLLESVGLERDAAIRREAALAGRIADPFQQSAWLATLWGVLGDGPLARELWNKACVIAPSQDLCMKKAGQFADQGDWKSVAEWYEKAWRITDERRMSGDQLAAAEDAAALYWWGWTLQKTDREAEGKKRMAAADLMMLADEDQRERVACWLDACGDKAGAARQRDFILMVRTTEEDHVLSSEYDRIGEYLECRNWAAAERAVSVPQAGHLRSGFRWISQVPYLTETTLPDLIRAHEMLVGGDLAGAMDIVRRHQKANPANGLLTAIFVPELGTLGHKAEADEVFRRRFEVLEEACRRFPQNPWSHNAVAWYCAVWARELDTALAHARRGLELRPGDADLLDTLAEVHFQRGEFKEAREAFQKCLEINPWAKRAPGRLRELDKPDEELKKTIGPWSLSHAWRDE